MRNQHLDIWVHTRAWHPLTEIPSKEEPDAPSEAQILQATQKTPAPTTPGVGDLSPALKRVLYDAITYPYSTVNQRIKRLGPSARVFEQAKREGLEKGLIIESAAGQRIYLIPTKKAYDVLSIDCTYKRAPDEHSFYTGAVAFALKQHPRYRTVQIEAKVGNTNASADCITIAHDGTREAWELTLSTTNVLANAAKYTGTDFVKITFVCRDYKLREAVKACCREGGLDPNVLGKLDYSHLSALFRRQRQMYKY